MALSSSRTLIVGCGFVGTQLALELTRGGGAAWGLSRTERKLPPGATSLLADVTRPETLDHLPQGVTHVVFCASSGGSSDEQYRAVYVTGSHNVLARLDGRSLQRVLFVSSTAVYAQERGEWIDEHAETLPFHFSGQRMLDAEREVASFGIETVSLRCGGIYGPGRTRLIESVRHGKASYDPIVPRFTNRIHRDDVAGALVHLMSLEAPAPIYVGVDEYPAPEQEVFEFIAARLKVEGPKPTIPRETGGGASNKRCSSALLRQHGYRFRFPTFREGYGAMLEHG